MKDAYLMPHMKTSNQVGGGRLMPVLAIADEELTKEEKVKRAKDRLDVYKRDMLVKGKKWVDEPSEGGYLKKY